MQALSKSSFENTPSTSSLSISSPCRTLGITKDTSLAPRADRSRFTDSAAARSLYIIASLRGTSSWNWSQHSWYSASPTAQSKLYPPNSSQRDPSTVSEVC